MPFRAFWKKIGDGGLKCGFIEAVPGRHGWVMRIRAYEPSDRGACLAVFASNTPDFFLPEEERLFARFLDRLPGPYLVAEEGTTILGCGGYAVNPGIGAADLCWGMVTRACHRRGLGRALLLARLARIAGHCEAVVVRLETSQHSRAFFEREGFAVREVIPDGYGADLHRCKLDLILDGTRRAEWVRRWAEQQVNWAE